MNIHLLACKLAAKTLQIPDFEKALRFTLSYLEGLSVHTEIDQAEVIQLISAQDKRFKNGYRKESIILKNDQFNSANGTVYLSCSKAREIRNNGDYGILYVMGRGL